MKRVITILILLYFFISCSTPKKASNEIDNFNGVWIPVQQELGGQPLPASAFANQKLSISDTTYIFVAESTDKGIVKYNHHKMDIYGKEGVNTGKHFTATYKLEKGQLFICYNLKGNAYPSSFDTKSAPALFLSVFKKIQ